MANTTHTPGTWVATPYGDIESTTGLSIGTTNPVPLKPIDAANARLMAAAPELLEALTHFLAASEAPGKVWSKDMSVGRRERLLAESDAYLRAASEKARAAIAKAKGEV